MPEFMRIILSTLLSVEKSQNCILWLFWHNNAIVYLRCMTKQSKKQKVEFVRNTIIYSIILAKDDRSVLTRLAVFFVVLQLGSDKCCMCIMLAQPLEGLSLDFRDGRGSKSANSGDAKIGKQSEVTHLRGGATAETPKLHVHNAESLQM